MNNWTKVKLGDVCQIVTGGTPSTSVSEYWENGTIPWLPSGMCQNTIIDRADTFITEAGLKNSAAKMMPVNTVVIALTGATTGKVGILKIEACANQSVTGILPSAEFDYEFLFYYLMYSRTKILEDSYGGAQKHISQGYVKKFLVPKPPIDTQHYIAKKIGKVRDGINICNTLLERMDLSVKGRFFEMFGDPVLNPKGWPQKPFLQMGKCKNGMNFRYDDSGYDIHCLGVGDFQDHSIISDTASLPTVSLNAMPNEDYLLKDDDIVFVRSNGNKALVGRSVAVYPGETPTTFSGFCIRYRKQDTSIIIPYLLRVLKTSSMRRMMAGRGANIQNLNQQILAKLMIPVPPMDLQEEFSIFTKKVESAGSVVCTIRDRLNTLQASLMQEYFG